VAGEKQFKKQTFSPRIHHLSRNGAVAGKRGEALVAAPNEALFEESVLGRRSESWVVG